MLKWESCSSLKRKKNQIIKSEIKKEFKTKEKKT